MSGIEKDRRLGAIQGAGEVAHCLLEGGLVEIEPEGDGKAKVAKPPRNRRGIVAGIIETRRRDVVGVADHQRDPSLAWLSFGKTDQKQEDQHRSDDGG
jgi:hypothetical protein